MFRSIAAKIAIAHLCYLGLFVFMVATTVITIGGQEEKQLVLRLTERQSMLSQRITQEVLGYALRVNNGENASFQRAAAASSMQMYENTQHALLEGGLVRLDLRLLNLGEIPQASDALVEQQRRVTEIYVPFRSYAQEVLDGNAKERKNAVDYVITHNSRLLTELDASATLMRVELEQHLSVVRWTQFYGFLAAVLLTLMQYFVGRRWFVEPLSKLSQASRAMSLGDVTQPISVDGPEELRELGLSFERLRVALKNFLATPESETSL